MQDTTVLTLTLIHKDVFVGEYFSSVVPRIGEKIMLRISTGSGTPLGGPLPYPVELPFSVEDITYTALNTVKREHWHTAYKSTSFCVTLHVTPSTQTSLNYVNRIKLLAEAQI